MLKKEDLLKVGFHLGRVMGAAEEAMGAPIVTLFAVEFSIQVSVCQMVQRTVKFLQI